VEYDAELAEASANIGQRGQGLIFGDKKGRFQDGTLVSTSKVTKIAVQKGETYLITLNSMYKVKPASVQTHDICDLTGKGGSCGVYEAEHY